MRIRITGWPSLGPTAGIGRYYVRFVVRVLLQPLGLIRLAQDLGIRKRPANPETLVSQGAKNKRADVQEILGFYLRRPGIAPPDLGDLPLLVITAADPRRDSAYQAAWETLQAELDALSTRSTHVVMRGVGHHINKDDPAALAAQVRAWIARQ